MHLGIDFGTTNTIVASVDRGNYPVVGFLDENGDARDFFPSVVAEDDGRLVYGFEALAAARDGAPMVRSFKRLLASPEVSPSTPVEIGEREYELSDVLSGFLEALREALRTSSSIQSHLDAYGEGHVIVAVPAHARGAQRFLTLDAFHQAGFDVTAMVNEPSAAGFEYTHRQSRTLSSRRTRVIVYDLGGGTFDASLVTVDGRSHDVLGSLGLNNLGGDDFDAELASLVIQAARIRPSDLGRRGRTELLEECREAKERISPQSRRITVEVPRLDLSVSVPVERYYQACAPLVQRSIQAMSPLVGELDDGQPDLTEIAGIYLVGGGSGLPLVPRVLREKFGRRVHRSPFPAASTAIGLAIAADEDAGYSLTDRLNRGFGVFREGADGRLLRFDPIISRDEQIPMRESVVVTRRYRAAHNVGWFRFVEHTSVDQHGDPQGDIVPVADVLFPFDAALQHDEGWDGVRIRRTAHGPMVEERYVIDDKGLITVTITDLDTGYTTDRSLQAASG